MTVQASNWSVNETSKLQCHWPSTIPILVLHTSQLVLGSTSNKLFNTDPNIWRTSGYFVRFKLEWLSSFLNHAHRTLASYRWQLERGKGKQIGSEGAKIGMRCQVGQMACQISPRNNASFLNHWAPNHWICPDSDYLICIDLSFLYEPRRHAFGLSCLLGWVSLVLSMVMLVLSL